MKDYYKVCLNNNLYPYKLENGVDYYCFDNVLIEKKYIVRFVDDNLKGNYEIVSKEKAPILCEKKNEKMYDLVTGDLYVYKLNNSINENILSYSSASKVDSEYVAKILKKYNKESISRYKQNIEEIKKLTIQKHKAYEEKTKQSQKIIDDFTKKNSNKR